MRVDFYRGQEYQFSEEVGTPPTRITVPVTVQHHFYDYDTRPVATYDSVDYEVFRLIDLWEHGELVHIRYVPEAEFESEVARLIAIFNYRVEYARDTY
jgi:hypothetical protein